MDLATLVAILGGPITFFWGLSQYVTTLGATGIKATMLGAIGTMLWSMVAGLLGLNN